MGEWKLVGEACFFTPWTILIFHCALDLSGYHLKHDQEQSIQKYRRNACHDWGLLSLWLLSEELAMSWAVFVAKAFIIFRLRISNKRKCYLVKMKIALKLQHTEKNKPHSHLYFLKHCGQDRLKTIIKLWNAYSNGNFLPMWVLSRILNLNWEV